MRKQLLFVINRTLFDIHSWKLSRSARHPISGKTYRLSSLSVIMSVPMVPLGQSSFLCLLLPFLSAVKAVLSLFRHKSLLCPQKQQESLAKVFFSPLVTENRGGTGCSDKTKGCNATSRQNMSNSSFARIWWLKAIHNTYHNIGVILN